MNKRHRNRTVRHISRLYMRQMQRIAVCSPCDLVCMADEMATVTYQLRKKRTVLTEEQNVLHEDKS